MYCCEDRALRTLELKLRVHYMVPHLLLVDDAREEIRIRQLIKLLIAEVKQTQAVDVGESHIELTYVTLQLVDHLLYRAPFCYVGTFE